MRYRSLARSIDRSAAHLSAARQKAPATGEHTLAAAVRANADLRARFREPAHATRVREATLARLLQTCVRVPTRLGRRLVRVQVPFRARLQVSTVTASVRTSRSSVGGTCAPADKCVCACGLANNAGNDSKMKDRSKQAHKHTSLTARLRDHLSAVAIVGRPLITIGGAELTGAPPIVTIDGRSRPCTNEQSSSGPSKRTIR